MTRRCFGLFAAAAVVQMTAPTPAAAYAVVPICGLDGGQGHAIPIGGPGRRDEPGGSPCCKICHISMRKRGGSGNCCDDDGPVREDEPDAA